MVLDTHAWLWWMAAPERLSETAREAVASTDQVGVSTLSVWEVAMLSARGRVTLDRDVRRWVRQALAPSRVEPLPPTVDVAIAAAALDPERFPGDPVDRIIYSTASTCGARLLTRDRAIRRYDPELTIW